jgi:hypothetical protein
MKNLTIKETEVMCSGIGNVTFLQPVADPLESTCRPESVGHEQQAPLNGTKAGPVVLLMLMGPHRVFSTDTAMNLISSTEKMLCRKNRKGMGVERS